MTSPIATVCFLWRSGKVLLQERAPGRVWAGRLNGPGGKVNMGETPRAAIVREVAEETGLRLADPSFHGVLDLVFGTPERSRLRVFVFSGDTFTGRVRGGREGRLRWYSADKLPFDRLWPDMRYWLPIVLAGGSIEGKCVFDEPGDRLLSCSLRLELETWRRGSFMGRGYHDLAGGILVDTMNDPKDQLSTTASATRTGLPAQDLPLVILLSVNVGLPTEIGTNRWGKPIRSGIVKRPVGAATLSLDALNLEGDRQADLAVHGGSDKAVYAYPAEHLPRWNAELGVDFGSGTFGENLTTAGWLEDGVRIGDVWSWGEALLQVSQPRFPCYKLATVTGRPDLPKRFVRSGRTGWYLRVLEPGTVPVAGPIRVVARDPAGVTVLDAHRALTAETGRGALEVIAGVPALAAAWREPLHARLAGMPPHEPE